MTAFGSMIRFTMRLRMHSHVFAVFRRNHGAQTCGIRRNLNEIAPGFECPAEHKPSAEYGKPPVFGTQDPQGRQPADLPLGQPIKRELVDREQSDR